jgi:hypothetical protein
MEKTPREKAQDRVREWNQLQAYEPEIMYDWPEGDEHWLWVCTAPVQEIVEWAASIRDGEV